MREPRQFFVHANGLQFCVQQRGPAEGPVILLIMGLACQLTHWPEPLLDGLAEAGYRVICFDNRDIGLSEKLRSLRKVDTRLAFVTHRLGLLPRANYTLMDMAADTAALLQAMGIDKAHVVGVSMGGMIAQILAARYPGRVAALTLIMTSTNDHRLPMPELSLIWKLSRSRPAAESAAAVVNRWTHFWKAVQSPAYPSSSDSLRQLLENCYHRNYSPGGTLRQLQAILATGTLNPLLREIHCPTRIIHGLQDPLIRVEAARDLHRRIRRSHMHLIPGMGHDLPEALIGSFIRLILLDSALAARAARSA